MISSKARKASYLVSAVVAVAALAGCGQHAVGHVQRASDVASATATATPTPAAATTSSVAHQGGTPGRPAPAPSPSGAPQYMAGTIPARVTASLASQCVQQGLTQQLTINTTPGFYVSYDVEYSDHKEGATYGGRGYGPVPPTGTYISRWIVGATAPSGPAVVYVAVEGGHPLQTAFRQLTFQVGGC